MRLESSAIGTLSGSEPPTSESIARRQGKFVTARARRLIRGKPQPSESQVLRACLELLQRHPKIAFAWRANAGAMQNPSGQWVKFGFRGMPDLMAVIKPTGRFLAVEVKRPGKQPTAAQDAFLQAVVAAGGYALWVDDALQLKRLLDNG